MNTEAIRILEGLREGATPVQRAAITMAINAMENQLEWHDLRIDPTDLPPMPKPHEYQPSYITLTEHECLGELYDSVNLLTYADGWNCSLWTDGSIYKKNEMFGITKWAEIPNVRW